MAGLWLVFLYVSGSAVGSLALLLVLAVFLVVCAVALRSLGIGRDHPMVRSLSTRPWRDGREVLALALRHLPEAFIITPTGALLAPNAIDLCMNPDDVQSLASIIDLSLVNASAAEAYAAEISACTARVLPGVPIEVEVVADPSVPEGRYALRQRRAPGQPQPAGIHPGWNAQSPYTSHPGGSSQPGGSLPGYDSWPGQDRTPAYAGAAAGSPPAIPLPAEGLPATRSLTTAAMTTGAMTTAASTVAALAPHPLLRLVTGSRVTQTRISGARAGRSRSAELRLPDEPTVSREHAQFTCENGEWRINGSGLNGVTLNGARLTGEHPVRDGDVIQWGLRPDSLSSHVEIRP